MNLRNSQIRWIILSFCVIAIDLLTKSLASKYLIYATPVEVLPFFNLTLLHNYGAAFSFLSNANTLWQVVLLSSIAIIVALVIFIWLLRLPKQKANNLNAASLALILGGAIGNLYDRMIHGYVVDFLDFHIAHYHWPAFNIADSAICIGAVGIILLSFGKKKA
ncbi:signal peptidase II [Fangia hongkongensis]|uniref:signal peptidase II n=1 Tax=Fangia hongkongensis TaxID=270495 RepID=UPI0003749D1C|nr:signal peptidase II [Fangia hongkongensis]MBK2125369.1 lipoprotein signal peptidase [Fangia hongkongensis]